MTEMLAALLGALLGGLLSAGGSAWQTGKVLKHETAMAAAERREAERVEDERRQSVVADRLIAALASCLTSAEGRLDALAHFVRVRATDDVHRDRDRRESALLESGASYSHALPEPVRDRWDALTWLVRFNTSTQPERSDDDRRRDYSDLLNYSEYVRRSLRAVSGDDPMPPPYPAPDVRRAERRVWGYKPAPGNNEPDLSDWQLSSRLVGEVTFSTGEVRWYGLNGLVEVLSPEPAEPRDDDNG
ncbi:hypothetical protein JOE58_002914 [Curtobacterium luteum]|uniref:Uncharacterized protein n=1 Tax=Curtobacterium luteum TaxID=33881 RepID=A0A8H9G9F6_9MICO|nr:MULTISPECIES: hypothetical protein [Curtobacterium]MBM7803663.1 hypothetical protein [Curtobacterium luteum]NUU49963.1 hypothetical protein [Curtobacterium luteum]GGK98721.1 hypothetical protein GCM10009769_16180 [Curtobacterium luteum]